METVLGLVNSTLNATANASLIAGGRRHDNLGTGWFNDCNGACSS